MYQYYHTNFIWNYRNVQNVLKCTKFIGNYPTNFQSIPQWKTMLQICCSLDFWDWYIYHCI